MITVVTAPSPQQRDAAINYHGKLKPPLQRQYKMELEGVIVLMDERGWISPDTYRLENVSGKLMSEGSDLVAYRIVFDPLVTPIECDISISVQVCPGPLVANLRRRNGRPECGFMTRPITTCPPVPEKGDGAGNGKNSDAETKSVDAFVCETAYSVVLTASSPTYTQKTGRKRCWLIKELYFTLVDCDFENLFPPPPLWYVQADASKLLSETQSIWGRWHSLPCIHPDPAVDPGVPIEQRPQGDPRWYWFRKECESYDVFKGKLSGSRLWKFFGGGYKKTSFLDDVGFKGNYMTRYGRFTESSVALNYLLHFPDVHLYECGTFMHPSIPDFCATPDGIIVDKNRTYKMLPKWFRDAVQAHPDTRDRIGEIDWTRGIFEAKTMIKVGKRGDGPNFKPEYICQMYAEMICANVHWGEMVRYCHETGECRMYRLFRKPSVSRAIERCVTRMRKEMLAGTPYLVAVEHESPQAIVKEILATAAFYNEPGVAPRFHPMKWNATESSELTRRILGADTVASVSETQFPQTIAQLNEIGNRAEPATHQKRQPRRGGKKGAKTASSPPPPQAKESRLELSSSSSGKTTRGKRQPRNTVLWEEIVHTTDETSAALANGHWEQVMEAQVFDVQIARYQHLKRQVQLQLEKKGPKKRAKADVSQQRQAELLLDSRSIFTLPGQGDEEDDDDDEGKEEQKERIVAE